MIRYLRINQHYLEMESGKRRKKEDTKAEVTKANRNILGKLLSLSARVEEPIDFAEALIYPLFPIHFPDGTKWKTQKSKTLEILELKDQTIIEKKAATIVIDMIAQLRSVTNSIPDTFEDLILRFLNSIVKGFVRVDIVADCYRDTSITITERQTSFTKFYSCSENKNQLIKLLFGYVKKKGSQVSLDSRG